LAMACEIRSWRSRRGCGIGGCPNLGGHGMGPALPVQAFCTWGAIFLWQWSERHSLLMCYNQCCQRELNDFPYAFQVISCLYL
jgi:hypothetical protein